MNEKRCRRIGREVLYYRVAALKNWHDCNGREGGLCPKRFEGLAIVRIIQKGEPELRMFMPCMREVFGQRDGGWGGLLMAAELTIEIARQHRMNRPAVDMSGFSMMVIRFRMHMEQGDCEHPHGQPHEDCHARPP